MPAVVAGLWGSAVNKAQSGDAAVTASPACRPSAPAREDAQPRHLRLPVRWRPASEFARALSGAADRAPDGFKGWCKSLYSGRLFCLLEELLVPSN